VKKTSKPFGYWKDLDTVLAAARDIMAKQGLTTLPTSEKLRELGHGDFLSGVGHHGGLKSVRELMGEQSVTKPSGYWKNEGHVIAEVRKVMTDHGFETMPTQTEFYRLGQSSLASAISKYHGGFARIRQLFGEQHWRRPNGTWKDIDYTVKKAEEIMRKHNFENLPGSKVLSRMGYSSFAGAISKHHGGFRNFRKSIGAHQVRKQKGVWKDLEFTVQQALEVMKEHGLTEFPTNKRLRKLCRFDLANAIHKYHGGVRKFREILGQRQIRKAKGVWKDFDYVIQQACEVVKKNKLNRLPASKELSRLGYSNLVNAIVSYHGGFHVVRKALGEDLLRTQYGLWKDAHYTVEQAQTMLQEHNLTVLPSEDTMKKLGYSGLRDAIKTYHGGFPAFRRVLAERNGSPSEKEQLEGILRAYVEEKQ